MRSGGFSSSSDNRCLIVVGQGGLGGLGHDVAALGEYVFCLDGIIGFAFGVLPAGRRVRLGSAIGVLGGGFWGFCLCAFGGWDGRVFFGGRFHLAVGRGVDHWPGRVAGHWGFIVVREVFIVVVFVPVGVELFVGHLFFLFLDRQVEFVVQVGLDFLLLGQPGAALFDRASGLFAQHIHEILQQKLPGLSRRFAIVGQSDLDLFLQQHPHVFGRQSDRGLSIALDSVGDLLLQVRP